MSSDEKNPLPPDGSSHKQQRIWTADEALRDSSSEEADLADEEEEVLWFEERRLNRAERRTALLIGGGWSRMMELAEAINDSKTLSIAEINALEEGVVAVAQALSAFELRHPRTQKRS